MYHNFGKHGKLQEFREEI